MGLLDNRLFKYNLASVSAAMIFFDLEFITISSVLYTLMCKCSYQLTNLSTSVLYLWPVSPW